MPTQEMTEPRPVVAFDVEGTLSTGQGWQGMRDWLRDNGRTAAYRRFFIRQLPAVLRYQLRLGDRQGFKEQWMLRLLRLFEGVPVAAFEAMGARHAEQEILPNLRPAVVEALRQHQAAGRRVVLVSGLFQPLLEPVARALAAEALGSPLEVRAGLLTGQGGPLGVGEQKVRGLTALLGAAPLYAAYGDTDRDIPMLAAAQHPTAVCPDKALRATAQARDWPILE